MTISREEMLRLDRRATEEFAIPSLLLMENAGMGIFQQIKMYNSYTVVVSGGNNGGDGLVLARHLLLNGKDVEVFIIKGKQSPDFSCNLTMLAHLTSNIFFVEKKRDLQNLAESLEVSEVCIDGIFGTGLCREVTGIYYDVIEMINVHGNFVISIDIPSGMDADTGDEWNCCVIAHETYAISEVKQGCTLNNKSGKIKTVYIGIPKPRGDWKKDEEKTDQ